MPPGRTCSLARAPTLFKVRRKWWRWRWARTSRARWAVTASEAVVRRPARRPPTTPRVSRLPIIPPPALRPPRARRRRRMNLRKTAPIPRSRQLHPELSGNRNRRLALRRKVRGSKSDLEDTCISIRRVESRKSYIWRRSMLILASDETFARPHSRQGSEGFKQGKISSLYQLRYANLLHHVNTFANA